MNFQRYLLFGCGQLGVMVLARFFFQWILRFVKVGQLPPGKGEEVGPEAALFTAAAVGAVLLAFRLFDGVTDPVAGILSDSWVKKGRQRRKLLWFAFLLPPVGLVLIFWPDGEMSQALRWALLVAGMFVFFVGYTFYAIPYWSLIGDYSGEDAGRRRVLSNVLGGGLLGATALGFIISPLLTQRFGFRTAAIAFALVAIPLMCLPYFARPDDAKTITPGEGDEGESVFKGLKTAFRHRRFLAFLAAFSGSQMSFTVMTAGAAFIVTGLLGGTDEDSVFILAPFLGTALPCFVFVPWVSRRLGWEKGVVLASIGLAFVYAVAAMLGESIIYSPMVTAAVVFAFGGPMAAVLLGLEGEAITACAREAGGEVGSIYWGVFNFVVKGLNGVAITLTGVLVDQTDHPDHGEMATRGILFLAGVLLVLGVGLYFLIRPRGPQEGFEAPPEDAVTPTPTPKPSDPGPEEQEQE